MRPARPDPEPMGTPPAEAAGSCRAPVGVGRFSQPEGEGAATGDQARIRPGPVTGTPVDPDRVDVRTAGIGVRRTDRDVPAVYAVDQRVREERVPSGIVAPPGVRGYSPGAEKTYHAVMAPRSSLPGGPPGPVPTRCRGSDGPSPVPFSRPAQGRCGAKGLGPRARWSVQRSASPPFTDQDPSAFVEEDVEPPSGPVPAAHGLGQPLDVLRNHPGVRGAGPIAKPRSLPGPNGVTHEPSTSRHPDPAACPAYGNADAESRVAAARNAPSPGRMPGRGSSCRTERSRRVRRLEGTGPACGPRRPVRAPRAEPTTGSAAAPARGARRPPARRPRSSPPAAAR